MSLRHTKLDYVIQRNIVHKPSYDNQRKVWKVPTVFGCKVIQDARPPLIPLNVYFIMVDLYYSPEKLADFTREGFRIHFKKVKGYFVEKWLHYLQPPKIQDSRQMEALFHLISQALAKNGPPAAERHFEYCRFMLRLDPSLKAMEQENKECWEKILEWMDEAMRSVFERMTADEIGLRWRASKSTLPPKNPERLYNALTQPPDGSQGRVETAESMALLDIMKLKKARGKSYSSSLSESYSGEEEAIIEYMCDPDKFERKHNIGNPFHRTGKHGKRPGQYSSSSSLSSLSHSSSSHSSLSHSSSASSFSSSDTLVVDPKHGYPASENVRGEQIGHGVTPDGDRPPRKASRTAVYWDDVGPPLKQADTHVPSAKLSENQETQMNNRELQRAQERRDGKPLNPSVAPQTSRPTKAPPATAPAPITAFMTVPTPHAAPSTGLPVWTSQQPPYYWQPYAGLYAPCMPSSGYQIIM